MKLLLKIESLIQMLRLLNVIELHEKKLCSIVTLQLSEQLLFSSIVIPCASAVIESVSSFSLELSVFSLNDWETSM